MKITLAAALVALPQSASIVRMEVLVLHRRRRAAPADLEAFFSELGFLVIQGYGLTETAPIVTLNHPFRRAARERSASRSPAWK